MANSLLVKTAMALLRLSTLTLGAAAVWLAGVAILGSGSAAATDKVLVAYVLLGASTTNHPQAHARVIVKGSASTCPELLAGNDRLPMSFRDNPHGFPVKVCEAIIPFGKSFEISWNMRMLPVATLDPMRILLFGDTGCKASDCSGENLAKPFEDLASKASQISPLPQLVIHVGDYNYRGTPDYVDFAGQKRLVYDAGDHSLSPQCQLDAPYVSQNAGYSNMSDSWEKWRDDFFEPARELLATIPFVFTRGNHELCSRAGPGWFYFLDASSDQGGETQLSCPPQGEHSPPIGNALNHLIFTPPHALNFGSLRLIVLDSASACDKYAPSTLVEIYRDQLRSVLANLDEKPTWIVSHRPIWGVKALCAGASNCPATSQAETINKTLQAALAETLKDMKGSPPGVRLFVSGHMHLFQSLTFLSTKQNDLSIPQIIVGNGGVKTSSDLGEGPFSASVNGDTAKGLTSTKHGFTTINMLDPDGAWRGQIVTNDGEALATCHWPIVEESLCAAHH